MPASPAERVAPRRRNRGQASPPAPLRQASSRRTPGTVSAPGLPPAGQRPALALPLAISALLAVCTFLVYGQVATHEFDNFDTNVFITDNPMVRGGLTWRGVVWAFTTFTTGNWYPLTWLSIMLDCHLFGANAGAHHLVSVGLHALSACLLLWLLYRLTGALWPAAWVAAAFALHPLHVESVAWAAQRKDVLSTLLLILTLWAYAGYVRRPSVRRFGVVTGVFSLGLLAKPMLVSVPVLLVLLDYWPLRRLPVAPVDVQTGAGVPRVSWRRAALEKLPLLLLAAALSVVTLAAQQGEGAVGRSEHYPLALRLGNAAVTSVTYVLKTVWPSGLAVFYPYPQSLPLWQWLPAVLMLLASTGAALYYRARLPYVAVGWCWYVAALVPVVGIIQVGRQARADRYTYLPHIGLFFAVAWTAAALVQRYPRWRVPLVSLATLWVLGWMAGTHRQVAYWRDSATLYRHALAVTQGNSVMHFNLGATYYQQADYPAAVQQFTTALRLDPLYPRGHYSLGVALSRVGRNAEAIVALTRELTLNPADADAHGSLGAELYRRGDYRDASDHFAQVVARRPQDPQARSNLAACLIELGRLKEAETQLRAALAQAPGHEQSRRNLATVLARQGAAPSGLPPAENTGSEPAR